MWQLCCARILLSVLRTFLRGAFQWLQPRSPVVQRAVERGRGRDPLDVSVEVQRSAPPDDALQARANRRAAALGSPRPSAKAADAKPRSEKVQRARAAVVVVVDPSLPWLA